MNKLILKASKMTLHMFHTLHNIIQNYYIIVVSGYLYIQKIIIFRYYWIWNNIRQKYEYHNLNFNIYIYIYICIFIDSYILYSKQWLIHSNLYIKYKYYDFDVVIFNL